MDMNAGLIAGSHHRNELVVIRLDDGSSDAVSLSTSYVAILTCLYRVLYSDNFVCSKAPVPSAITKLGQR